MNIAFYELEPWEQEHVKKALRGHKLSFYNSPLGMDNVRKDTELLGIFIYSEVTCALLDKMPKLKLIATMSTGFDHIDIAYARSKGVCVCNVPTYGENTVAEHTFALILALSRKMYPSIKRTHEMHSFETDASLRGFDLKGKTIGIVGCGNIGRHVLRIAKGFEMNVLVFDPHRDEALSKGMGFAYATLPGLLKNSDIVTLHVPLLPQTKHLLDKRAFRLMKQGAYLVNTARGGLVETQALLSALTSGKLGGAALDVLEEETSIKEEKQLLHTEFKNSVDLKAVLAGHMLMKMENVVLTPHNAFNSSEALLRIINTTLDNLKSYAKTGKTLNPVA
ncbi:MAG: NAD(P)-dependent oxidoreductase [Nanoarchaeota archaeon]|nr:NAD(P)-dependent oxidoreductase [Nanoarchaeota archaeon]